MRIGVLSWESLHSIRVGGLAIVATKQSEELAKRGDEVHFFTRWKEGQTEYQYINGVHYHRCKFDPGPSILSLAYNMSKAFVARLHAVEKDYGKFDIVHGHDWHIVDALHDLKNEDKDVVMTFHSTEYGRNGGNFGDWYEFKEISGKEWYGGYIANRITTVSNTMKNELNWLYKIPLRKIDVITNGIDNRNYQMKVNQPEIKQLYGIPPESFMIFFVGRIVYQKGPDILLEAVPQVTANHRDIVFVFSGEGDMIESLRARASQLGLDNVVKFTGLIPYWEYIKLLNAADMVCIPSRNEPFGLVLLEAWATQKPVVVANVGGLGENIENYVDGLKVQPSADAFAWGINYLLDNPDIAKLISKNSFEKVKNYSWTNVIEKLKRTYELAMIV